MVKFFQILTNSVTFVRETVKNYSKGIILQRGGRLKCRNSVSNGSIQMQLTPIAANQTQLNLNDGTEVFFSYKTPVAAKLPNYDYIRTATKWSSTTTRHINKWLEGVHAEEVPQNKLDELVGE